MVEHRTQGVLAARRHRGQLNGLRDSGTQRAGMVGVTRDDILTGTGRHRGRTRHSSPEGAHDRRAVGLLLHRYLHLINGSLQAEYRSRIGQGGAPLSGTGLGGDIGRALLLGIVALGQGRVDLVGTQGIHRLVLEIDVCRRLQRLFQGIGAHQRRTAIGFIFVHHLVGDGDEIMFGVQFLDAALAREDVGQIVHTQRLLGGRMKRGHGLVGHIGLNVIPCCGQLVLLQNKSFLFHFGYVFILIMFKGLSQVRQTFNFFIVISMIPNGHATHDFFNLEQRHHQFTEILVIIFHIYFIAANIYPFSIATKHFLKKMTYQGPQLR